MPEETSQGDCYICGVKLGKTAMKKHLLEHHGKDTDGEQCYLLKVEDRGDMGYWFYIDIPVNRKLSDIDNFLRKIWLECCGHLSAFFYGDHIEIEEDMKLTALSEGKPVFHLYDYGSTTETAVTLIGTTVRKPQRIKVRIMARNSPPDFRCADCGKPACFLCEEFVEPLKNQFYCGTCAETHEDDDHYLHPVTNSPRMGICGYDGELDTFEFQPWKTKKPQPHI